VAGRFYQGASFAGLRIGSRSAPLECFVLRTGAPLWGALWPAQQSCALRQLDGVLQGGSGWHLISLGDSGRGGFGVNQTSFSFRFQTPLSHLWSIAGLSSGAPEERLHRKERRFGDQRLEQRSDLPPSTLASMRAAGRPSRTVCGPSHELSPTPWTLFVE
jgi:hypothetical protein